MGAPSTAKGGDGEDVASLYEPETGVRRVAREATQTLAQAHVGQDVLSMVPIITLSPTELFAANLDHRAGFLVSLIDGVTTVESVLDLCGMPTDEALVLLERLQANGIVSMCPPNPASESRPLTRSNYPVVAKLRSRP